MVSVLMSTFNEAAFVEEAVESILSQTFVDFEFIIVDDDSTDGTRPILRNFDDQRIVLIENDENIGFVRSLNKGLDECTGKYVARMDGDDVSERHRLETQLRYLESKPDTGIVGSFYWKVTGSGVVKKLCRKPATDVEIRFELLLAPPFAHPSVMFERALLEEHNIRYSPHYPGIEDYDLWPRLLRHTCGENIPEPLLRYRVHGNNQSLQNRRNMLREHDKIALRVVREYVPDFDTTLREVSQLRMLVHRGYEFSPYDIDNRRSELAGRYLDLFNAYKERYRNESGISKVKRTTVETTLRILLDDRWTNNNGLVAIPDIASLQVLIRTFRLHPLATVGGVFSRLLLIPRLLRSTH